MTKSYEKDLVNSLNILDTFLIPKKNMKLFKSNLSKHAYIFFATKKNVI